MNADFTYDITGPSAKAVATMMEQREPNLVVSKMSKEPIFREIDLHEVVEFSIRFFARA